MAALNLLCTDADLRDYDATLKVLPPLRTLDDQAALREALVGESADALVSNHRPHDTESHRVEFPYASFGAATIELAFAIAATAVGHEVAAGYLGGRNRRLVGVEPATITDGATAELSFYCPDVPFEVPPDALRSLGVNVPLVGRTLRGVPAGTLVESRWRPSPWLRTIAVVT